MAALAYVLDDTAEPWRDPVLTADQRLTELAAELTRRAPAAQQSGLDDDQVTRWEEYAGEVVFPMLEIQAQGIDGLRAKAAAVVWTCGDEETFRELDPIDATTTYNKLVRSIVSDLIAKPQHHLNVVGFEPAIGQSDIAKTAAQWLAERQVEDATWDQSQDAAEAAYAEHPKPPAILRDPLTKEVFLDRDHYAHMDRTAQRVGAIPMGSTPRLDAFHQWRTACDAIDAAFRVAELEDEVKRLFDVSRVTAERLAAMEPRTLQEAVVKYGILLAAYGTPGRTEGKQSQPDIYNAAPFFAFMQDLERLAELT